MAPPPTLGRGRTLGQDPSAPSAEPLCTRHVVRRAERGIGLAIRKGQAAGVIAKPGDIGGKPTPGIHGSGPRGSRAEHLDRPAHVASESKAAVSDFYQMTDGVSDEQFDEAIDEAIDEAKDEQNLSRANVVRKVRAKREAGRETRDAVLADEVIFTPRASAGT